MGDIEDQTPNVGAPVRAAAAVARQRLARERELEVRAAITAQLAPRRPHRRPRPRVGRRLLHEASRHALRHCDEVVVGA